MSETKKITNIITPNGEDLQLTDSEAVHKENNIITEKITLANQLEFVPSNENTDSSLPTPVLSMDETNGGLRIDGRVVQGNSTNIASGANSHAEGIGARGNYCEANGNGSHAEGAASYAGGAASHAEGLYSKSLGMGSHSEGHSTYAYGNYSHTEGATTRTGKVNESETTGLYAHAEGYSTKAIGEASHAEGRGTQALGKYSLAIGRNTVTGDENGNGLAAFASGDDTKALEFASSSFGLGTQTSRSAQMVIGKYNTNNSQALFIIGNGTGFSPSGHQSNALEVLEDGAIILKSPNKYFKLLIDDDGKISTQEYIHS